MAQVVVVEDEESLGDLVSTALGFVGHQVTALATGLAALDHLRTHACDLVILDVNLPDYDGFDLCRRLREDGLTMPVIFLTARADLDDLRTGFRQGGDDYMTKPFRLEELTLRVEAVLRRTATPEASADLVCGLIRLDEAAHRVTVDGEETELSPTEFRLLEYLMLNPGRLLSRQQILDYVWGYDFDGDLSIVERYVSYLRRRLGAVGAQVRTVRGMGYQLRPETGA